MSALLVACVLVPLATSLGTALLGTRPRAQRALSLAGVAAFFALGLSKAVACHQEWGKRHRHYLVRTVPN